MIIRAANPEKPKINMRFRPVIPATLETDADGSPGQDQLRQKLIRTYLKKKIKKSWGQSTSGRALT
jgi:hypothetical protein